MTTDATFESLIFKRAVVSRPSVEWKDDDYDVLADGVVVGLSDPRATSHEDLTPRSALRPVLLSGACCPCSAGYFADSRRCNRRTRCYRRLRS